MGCCVGKVQIVSKEEQLIREKEAAIGFSHFTCHEMDVFIRKICSKPHLNSRQFQAFMEKLSRGVGINKIDASILCFFRLVVYYKGEYDRTLLLIMVVLHCRGTAEDRARILTEIVDSELTREINYEQTYTLVHYMVEIALISCFILIDEEKLDVQTAKNLRRYQSRFKRIRDKVETEVLALFAEENSGCRLEDLQRKVASPATGSLLTAEGLRDFACKLIQDRKQKKRLRPVAT